MIERKRTKTEERAYAAAMTELYDLEIWNAQRKLRDKHVPAEWHRLAKDTPTRPKKERVTAAYDADMVKWYRGLGHGYQARMNKVLRTYMLLVISKEITSAADLDWKGDPI